LVDVLGVAVVPYSPFTGCADNFVNCLSHGSLLHKDNVGLLIRFLVKRGATAGASRGQIVTIANGPSAG
jgi:hypothetical protein